MAPAADARGTIEARRISGKAMTGDDFIGRADRTSALKGLLSEDIVSARKRKQKEAAMKVVSAK